MQPLADLPRSRRYLIGRLWHSLTFWHAYEAFRTYSIILIAIILTILVGVIVDDASRYPESIRGFFSLSYTATLVSLASVLLALRLIASYFLEPSKFLLRVIKHDLRHIAESLERELKAPTQDPRPPLRVDPNDYRILQDTTNDIAKLASSITRAPCAVSIKLLSRPKADASIPIVVTVMRDRLSKIARPEPLYEDGHPYTESAAFSTIIRSNSARDFFASDDLLNLRTDADMLRHHNHREIYTGMMVVPICERYGAVLLRPDLTSLVGFICVYAMHGTVAQVALLRALRVIGHEIHRLISAFQQLQTQRHDLRDA